MTWRYLVMWRWRRRRWVMHRRESLLMKLVRRMDLWVMRLVGRWRWGVMMMMMTPHACLLVLLLQLLQLKLLPLKLLELLCNQLILLIYVSWIHIGHIHIHHPLHHPRHREHPKWHSTSHWIRHQLLLLLKLGWAMTTHSETEIRFVPNKKFVIVRSHFWTPSDTSKSPSIEFPRKRSKLGRFEVFRKYVCPKALLNMWVATFPIVVNSDQNPLTYLFLINDERSGKVSNKNSSLSEFN